jgi:hypothetical protein
MVHIRHLGRDCERHLPARNEETISIPYLLRHGAAVLKICPITQEKM